MDSSLATANRYTAERAYEIFDLLDVSELTRADYKYRIASFLQFVTDRGLSNNSFLDYKRFLGTQDSMATATKNKYLVTAKIFLKELNRLGIMPVDITQNVRGFRQSKKHRKDGLNSHDVELLRDWLLQADYTPKNIRLRAIMALLIFQGLRSVEVVRLNVTDIDFNRDIIYVRGKGSDDVEPVHLHPIAARNLYEYVGMNIKDFNGPLFLSMSNSSQNHRLTTRGLRAVVTSILAELGIHKSVHGFRHYFTTQMIKSYKGDLLEVQQYTRHKSLETLQIYYDAAKREADLPRFYKTFENVEF